MRKLEIMKRSTIIAGLALMLTAGAAGAVTRNQVHPKLVIGIGDSITSGGALTWPETATAPSLSWPGQATTLSNGRWTVTNDGINSDTMADAAGEWIVQGETPMQTRLSGALAERPWAVVLLGGTNDIGHVTVRAEERAILNIAHRTEARGVEFIVSTIPPVGIARPDLVALDPERNAVNAWIRRHFHGAHLVDFYNHLEVDGLLPDSEQAQDDGVHPSTAAERWFAQAVLGRLNMLSAQTIGSFYR